jgi:hypothetical protein
MWSLSGATIFIQVKPPGAVTGTRGEVADLRVASIRSGEGCFPCSLDLADGSTVIVGVNKLQMSFSGGDGNDLTLTVVPYSAAPPL